MNQKREPVLLEAVKVGQAERFLEVIVKAFDLPASAVGVEKELRAGIVQIA